MSKLEMTTIRAFYNLIHKEDYLLIWLQSGLTKEDRARYRHRLKKAQISDDKMAEILLRAGFSVQKERIWNKPLARV